MKAIELRQHFKYKVRGQEMFFWRLHIDGTPEFYHYKIYGNTRHIIYFWDKDILASEIERVDGPMINNLSTELVAVMHN